jgi:hypothetical protein
MMVKEGTECYAQPATDVTLKIKRIIAKDVVL